MFDPVQVTRELIAFNSISANSNAAVSDYLQEQLDRSGFTVERITYRDANGVEKVNLVGRKGEGRGGLALLGHSDTVPVDGWESDPFSAEIRDNRIYGRGSCDMKGALATMLAAGGAFEASELSAPVYLVFTADEEVGCWGAAEVSDRSELLADGGLRYGIICEPTRMEVVRAHKGAVFMRAETKGRAAHSSTGRGVNAHLAMIPFLSEMKAIHDELRADPRHLNDEFDPPFSDWNIGINDGGIALNMTAPSSVCTVYYRPMPGQDQEAILDRTRQAADRCGVELTIQKIGDPFSTDPDSDLVRTALRITGTEQAHTVPYGTDGLVFGKKMELILLGPGDISQAHTVDEWMDLDQFDLAIDAYKAMIRAFCV